MYKRKRKIQGPQGNVWPKLYLYVFNVCGGFNTTSTFNLKNHTQTLDFIPCVKVRPSFFLSTPIVTGSKTSFYVSVPKYIYIYMY